MPYLVLLSYGRESEYRRAIGTVLSAQAHHGGPPLPVLLFTDDAAYFQPYFAGLPVEYVLLPEARRRALHGPHDYAFRVKIGILDEARHRHPGRALLYCDSDTFFRRSPAPLLRGLAAGTAYMHQPEYSFEQAVGLYADYPQRECPRRFIELIESHWFEVGGQPRQFTRRQLGWNSGVLGLPAAATALLPDVFTLTDEFYGATGWFTSEQLAFSLALPTRFPLHRADDYVSHYWGTGQKRLMDGLLAKLLTPTFAAHPLPARLAAVRQLTARWRRLLELDQLREGALYAFGRGRLLPGAKYALRAWARQPLNLGFPRQVLQVLRQQR